MNRKLLLLLLAGSVVSAGAQTVIDPAGGSSGGRQTAGNYVVDSSLGGVAGVASGGNFTARNGFAGQLYDVQTFGVSATATNVNEVSTLQLSASSVMDDGTTLPVTLTEVAWAVTSGPLHAISSGGLVTSTNVHSDTVATVQGTYQSVIGSLGLSVVNVGWDDFGSYAGDNIDDAWQVQNFGENSANAMATADPDNDEQNNLFEYLADTGPNDENSLFQLSVANAAVGTREIVFSPVTAGRTYSIQYLSGIGGSFAELTGAASADNSGVRTVTDTTVVNQRFYRVSISLP